MMLSIRIVLSCLFRGDPLVCVQLKHLLQQVDRCKVNISREDHLREDIKEKKTFSFGHCPNHLNPPYIYYIIYCI